MPTFYCGIDWGEGSNDVAVVSRAGAVVARARIAESPAGLAELFALLDGLRNSHTHGRRQVPVAIESVRGLLVEGLTLRRQPLYPIAPSLVAAYRRQLSPIRKKSDRADAELIAMVLRHYWGRIRPQHQPSPEAAALTVLVAAHSRAMQNRLRLQGQLRSLLRYAHPAALSAWAHLDGGLHRREARAVLAAAPTATSARRLTQYRLSKILAGAGRIRLVDDEAYRLHDVFAQPVIAVRPQVDKAMAVEVQASLTGFETACQVEDDLLQQVHDAVAAHPHVEILVSFPGCGLLTAARLLAALGDDPDRFADARGLRAYAGLAPITWASGSTKQVEHRRICNRDLKRTCHYWAFSSLTRSPGCRALYDRRRAVGDSYAGALRRVAGRLLTGLHYCLRTGAMYDESTAFPTPN